MKQLNDSLRLFQKISLVFIVGLCLFVLPLYAQVENVPVASPVYTFLKRMELKKLIVKYHDAILPLSRKQVAHFLQDVRIKQSELTETERDQLNDFYTEFEYDISGKIDNTFSIVDTSGFNLSSIKPFNDAEKYLYTYIDSNVSLFVDGLLLFDARRRSGDELDNQHTEFVQFGGRIRGTISNHLGYYLQGTNSQFWGSRDLLRRDKYISQAYTLNILDAKNFDFLEGYIRYAGEIVSVEVGKERLLWGTGYGDKLIVSDNIRVFDFIRGDAEYKSIKYTFIHGWLLGNKTLSTFRVSTQGDTNATFQEPVVADKFIGAHRLELSFPAVTFGFQEMAIYSNRSVDLAYLNPVTLIESAQRSREERDNILWAFDIKTHCIQNLEFQGTLLLDDFNFPKLGTSSYQNKFAFQAGAMVVDPFSLSNTTFALEYTRVNPYTFSHERSRDNNYGSLNRVMSHHIGPNSDSWFFRFDFQHASRLTTSFRFEIQREGEDSYDSTGNLMTNYGGDYLIPHRDNDPQQVTFLDGNRVNTFIGQVFVNYELINEVFLDLRYQYARRKEIAQNTCFTNYDYGFALRIDF